uniref:Neurosecretory protein VGF n=1 Tax=Salvator merianae TaxID=96440 RepID=A0A8D0BSY6_SALMN
MRWPQSFRRAAWLLSLCLLIQSRPSAAAPSSPGKEVRPGEASPKTQKVPVHEIQVRSLADLDADSESQKSQNDDLFQDVDPKVLAAVLLQALQNDPEKPEEQHPNPDPSASEEAVRSETKSLAVQPERERGWKGSKGGGQTQQEELEKEENRSVAEESNFGQQELETLKSMLEELKHYSPAAKREEPPRVYPAGAPGTPEEDVLQELDDYMKLKVHSKRKAPPGEPWAGARKLRQQQHLEHQLLQRRYEELAESRRQAEEARRAAAEEERLADMASDLLLQYLLKDGEEDEEGADSQGGSEEERPKGSSLLFEDEESNVAEDKRSNEMPPEEDGQEDEEDIDPHTIDRLIELSSKLHLPADDVIDLINNVEKKKKEVPELKGKNRAPAAPVWKQPPKSPPYAVYPQEAMPAQSPFRPPPYQPYPRLPKQDQAAWNEVWKGEEYPVPKWHRAKAAAGSSSSGKLSNYIDPRTSQPPAYKRLRHLPGRATPRDGYYDDRQGHDEEAENYIERVLGNHPKVFQ